MPRVTVTQKAALSFDSQSSLFLLHFQYISASMPLVITSTRTMLLPFDENRDGATDPFKKNHDGTTAPPPPSILHPHAAFRKETHILGETYHPLLLHPAVLEGQLDAGGHPQPVWARVRHVVRVAREGAPQVLCQDVGPPLLGVVQRLQHQHPRTLPHHKAVPLGVPRPGGALRLVAPRRECSAKLCLSSQGKLPFTPMALPFALLRCLSKVKDISSSPH